MRYFVYGYYGFGNFGDDLLLRGVVEGIRARDADAVFDVHSLNPVPKFDGDGGVHFTGLARRLQNVRRRPWKIMSYLAAFCRALEDCDVLVIGGGTLFIDKGRINVSLVLLALAAGYARLRSRRVVVIGVAVDCMTNPISLWAMRFIFATAEFISVRDDLSLPYSAPVPKEKVHRAADLVFGLDIGPAPRVSPRVRPVLGICFIDYFRTVEVSSDRHEAYREAIFHLVERHQGRYDVACIIFQPNIGQRDDWLVSVLQNRFSGLTIHYVDSIDAACLMGESVDVLLTTRFHLGILAILWDKPVIIVDHELKMAALAKEFALPVISLDDFIAGGDTDVDILLRTCDPHKTAAARVIERGRATVNFDWISK